MGLTSKNSRVGKAINNNNPTSYALPRYVPGNVGAGWKTAGKYNSQNGVRRLSFDVKSKDGSRRKL